MITYTSSTPFRPSPFTRLLLLRFVISQLLVMGNGTDDAVTHGPVTIGVDKVKEHVEDAVGKNAQDFAWRQAAA